MISVSRSHWNIYDLGSHSTLWPGVFPGLSSLPPYMEVYPSEWKYCEEARSTGTSSGARSNLLRRNCSSIPLSRPRCPSFLPWLSLQAVCALSQCADIHSHSTLGLQPLYTGLLCVFTLGLNDGHSILPQDSLFLPSHVL